MIARKHEIAVRIGPSKIWRNAMSGRPAMTARWTCSCGRVGPEYNAKFEPEVAKRKATLGGERHKRAATARRWAR